MGKGQERDHPVLPVGHGHFDMASYTNYMAGKLVDQDYDEKGAGDGLVDAAQGPA